MSHTAQDIEFLLNGKQIRAGGFATQCSLLDYLRSRGLTGVKEGCAEGECGACAVLCVDPAENGSRYLAVNSCLVPLPAVTDREILTVEALACKGQLSEVQEAMVKKGGSQCGYCTPGFIVSMFSEHSLGAENPRDPHRLGGNLCRCTGYRPIADALRSLPEIPQSPLIDRLSRSAPPLRPVLYNNNEQRYTRPCSLRDLLVALEDGGQMVAGNTDLGVLTNLRDRKFEHLVSTESVPELREFCQDKDAVEIGAALTLTEIAGRWKQPPAAFRDWLHLFASPLIRNRATLGGNLGTASPIGDAAPLLLSLDASVRMVSARSERTVPLDRFFTAYRRTVLMPGEAIRSVVIPKPFPARTSFYKVAKRKMDDISTVAAAFSLHLDDHGVVMRPKLAFGGVAATPLRAYSAEALLEGVRLESMDLGAVKNAIAVAVKPMDDHRGSAAYRRAMAQNLFEKFVCLL